ncbi:MAG: ferritin family protein [Chloroflexi bacterium]|nr:ferritin family protein [Chloroflexota bacterium]
MIDDPSEALAAIEQAARNERAGISFYRQAEASVRDPRGKAMYRSLVADEEVHLHILSAEYDRLNRTGDWVPLEKARQADARMADLFPDEVSGALLFTPDMSDLEAMKLAMDFERKGHEMYDMAARGSTNPAAANVYRFLAREESRHFELLQKSHDYLANNGIWYFDDVQAPQLD